MQASEQNKTDSIKSFFYKVKQANKEATKKEIFKDLLNRLYSSDSETKKVIDAISSGAEAAIVNIPRKDKLHRGSADTLYNKVIIEFENDLKVTEKHAKEQLAGYMLGLFNSGEGYNYTLIASDFIHWKVFAPSIDCLENIEDLNESELILEEIASASFTLTDKNAEEFFYWIDRFLFKEDKQKATLQRIEETFGYQSNVFIDSFRELTVNFSEAKKFGEVQVSFEQWKKFLSIAYGSFDASEKNFLIHTYLSVFSKMLAYSVISNEEYLTDEQMKGILDGTAFNQYNIRNFVENDFFHWVAADRNFRNLKKMFRLITQEISIFDFTTVEEDILKGVYQELIDLDTRHALGEYYTPDWLCERIMHEYDFGPDDKILDPACGSGSFLRAAIHRMKEQNPKMTSEEINKNIYGIDIHPLSVQIAKTTLLLSLGKDLIHSKRPVHLNILLANALLAPKGVKDLFGEEFKMYIDKDQYSLNTQILDNDRLFDRALDVCEDLATQTVNQKNATHEVLANSLKKRNKNGFYNAQIIDSFHQIYLGFKKVKEKKRDSIWKFIVQNLYKPYFLHEKFDYVIGNPPWFTYSSIKNEEYQNILNALAIEYNVKPERVANFPHLEIAAIFMAYCSSYFLKPKGKLSFVLPRSFFSADHHNKIRSGEAKGFRIKELWDLNDVLPLFRVPSCVFHIEKVSKRHKIPVKGVQGRIFAGRLPYQNCNWQLADEKLKEVETKWYSISHGKSSALSTKQTKSKVEVNPYKKHFKQGATIVPRSLYFVELNQAMPPDFDDRIVNIQTSEEVNPLGKPPWKGLNLSGRMESRFLFRTALSNSILPFALYNPALVVLPAIIDNDNNKGKSIQLLSSTELQKEGYLHASHWFQKAETMWELNRTEKNKNYLLQQYLNWQNKLTGQKLNFPYLVLYNSSAKNANATVVMRDNVDLEFVVESKTYVYYTNNLEEAYYLAAFLNSNAPNEMIKDFQTKGLFGPRDIHKRILDVFLPKYDSIDPMHQKVAELGKQAHQKSAQYLHENPPEKLTQHHLGRVRVAINKHLKKERDEIDGLVKKLIEGKK